MPETQPDVTGRSRRTAVPVLLLTMMLAGVWAANAQSPASLDCAGDVGNPASGSAQWDQADLNNQRCAAAGRQMFENNPAVKAAAAANADATPKFESDPFRAPQRWARTRGSYEVTEYKDRSGKPWSAVLFGPRNLNAGPYPGVLLVCHTSCPPASATPLWHWAAEALAEAGYVVLYATVGGNNVPRAIDATDFFVATPTSPTPRGDFNPWHASLDRSRLGVVGHSGAGGVALNAGHTDPRYKAIVAWDPFGPNMAGVTPRIPTMIQVADYGQQPVPPPRHEKPTPAPGSRFFYFDTIRAAGVDAMQVALRASMHFEWGPHFPPHPERPYSIQGEMVATYYTLAWLDRYLKGGARNALRRLTASGRDRFDKSADGYSIGSGAFDKKKADRAGNIEVGNVPITIGGVPVRNLLSFQYDSKYSLDGGKRQCADMRAGCR